VNSPPIECATTSVEALALGEAAHRVLDREVGVAQHARLLELELGADELLHRAQLARGVLQLAKRLGLLLRAILEVLELALQVADLGLGGLRLRPERLAECLELGETRRVARERGEDLLEIDGGDL